MPIHEFIKALFIAALSADSAAVIRLLADLVGRVRSWVRRHERK